MVDERRPYPSTTSALSYGGPTLVDMGDAPADDDERVALLALLDQRPALRDERRGKTTWSTIASEVLLRGSALAVWEESHPPALDGMDEPGGQLETARATLAEWGESDFRLVTVLDSCYPLALLGFHQVPPLLFIKGQLRADEVGVSVVGSRTATGRGRSNAASIARGLVDRGISVISGLAAGIDTAAHQAVIAAGGRPIGVLGTGINRVYPADGRDLHDRVAAVGTLISQFVPDAPPQKHTFGMRNATMVGLARASVIVEAGEHSGTRIQARVAVEQGRPVILTDSVVTTTNWGKEAQTQPGVYVAGSTADVMGIVDKVVADAALSGSITREPD
jgi:DNA protecting protein DprA